MTYDPLFPLQARMQEVSRELADANFDPLPNPNPEDQEAHAAGETCARCHQVIKAAEDVRRNASHEWIHENCPRVASPEEPS